jgi:hypothetical protein
MHTSTDELEAKMRTEDVLASCRSHVESLQNLSYLASLEDEPRSQVRLNLRMMQWHLRNLAELLLPKSDVRLPAA